MSDPTTVTRNSEERSPSLFVQALNEDAQAVFMGYPGREFILCCNLYLPKYNIPLSNSEKIHFHIHFITGPDNFQHDDVN